MPSSRYNPVFSKEKQRLILLLPTWRLFRDVLGDPYGAAELGHSVLCFQCRLRVKAFTGHSLEHLEAPSPPFTGVPGMDTKPPGGCLLQSFQAELDVHF